MKKKKASKPSQQPTKENARAQRGYPIPFLLIAHHHAQQTHYSGGGGRRGPLPRATPGTHSPPHTHRALTS
jgi:hypothetical protein